MARKSSKTAHVMNLLAGDETDASKVEAAKENISARQTSDTTETIKELTVLAQQASIQTQDGPLSPSPISIINMSSSAPDPVAERIRQQLEEEENTEEDHMFSSEGSNAEEITLNSDNTLPSSLQAKANENPDPEEKKEEEKGREEENAVQAISPQTAPPQEKPHPQPTYQYLNVMEEVVNSKVEEYMQKFDVCTCKHCVADVKALALTHLPSKYIVVEPPAVSPLLNFYSSRFSQQVIVELTKACSIVKENPHH